MGRTIPSFRILIDIEKSNWSSFTKYLNRKDRDRFDMLFYIPKLFCHSLSNLSKSIIFEPIMMINLFYNFKTLKIMPKTFTTKTEPLFKENKQYEMNIIRNNNQYIQDWKKFVDCLTKDDKNIFFEMINDCYSQYNKSINTNIKEKDADSCIARTNSLFMALLLYQQKQINLIKINQGFID